jgi:hypothetical protein
MSHADEKDSIKQQNDCDDEQSTTNADAPTDDGGAVEPNPPRTTTGRWFTAPKFGSAGSGGLELEPGSERD